LLFSIWPIVYEQWRVTIFSLGGLWLVSRRVKCSCWSREAVERNFEREVSSAAVVGEILDIGLFQ
jgi:hypothetical protein